MAKKKVADEEASRRNRNPRLSNPADLPVSGDEEHAEDEVQENNTQDDRQMEEHEERLGGTTDPGDAAEGSDINAQDELQPVARTGNDLLSREAGLVRPVDRHVDSKASPFRRSDDPDERCKVAIGDVGEKGIAINGHPIMKGQVVEMHPNDILAHRDAGVPMLYVSKQDKREVVDISEPYVSPERDEEEAA